MGKNSFEQSKYVDGCSGGILHELTERSGLLGCATVAEGSYI